MVSDAKKAAKARYDAKTAKRIGLKLNKNTDADIIRQLESQENIQAYIKRLIRNDINRGGKTMKQYIVKPEFLQNWQASPMTIITDSDIETFAADWDVSEDELRNQLIELPESGYTAIHRFAGRPNWQELNDLIREDSGVEEPYCETEGDYQRAVREGFIKYDGYYTTVYVDD